MYAIRASYLEGASLDLIGGIEISSILNLILWFHNILIHSIILLPTNKYLTLLNLLIFEPYIFFFYFLNNFIIMPLK